VARDHLLHPVRSVVDVLAGGDDRERVVVWVVDPAAGADPGWGLLSPEERRAFAAVRLPGPRRARVAARATLRRVLGARLGLAPPAVPLVRTPAGKLVLAQGCGAAGGDCSVSHTDGLVAVAVAPLPVGVDVERRDREALHEAAAAFLHPAERRALADRERVAAGDLLALLWTGKEAVAKALGTGFVGLDPADLAFAVPAGGPPVPWRVPALDPARVAVRWHTPDPAHVVAVATIARQPA
jgi:4'-phosphopantetheinyl transferase